MYRQSPSRNHRSKGIKLKHGIQICLLLAVCFWLIYQIKHSHDKKKEYDESDENDLRQRTSSEELMKLGRKDIRPRAEDGTISTNENNDEQEEEEEETTEEKDIPQVGETISKDENSDEQEEDEETTEEKIEENKAEDEPEDNVEQKEDETTGHGDDEIDEHEQEKTDTSVDREGELVDEEEREDIAENGTQEMDSEHAHEEISSEDTDRDGDDRSLNDAREEHYKADDASSAVTHDIRTAASRIENEHVEISNNNPENILGGGDIQNKSNEGERSTEIEVEGVQMAGDNQQLNATTGETKVDTVNNSENGSFSNDTVTEMFNSHLATNSSTEVTVENHDVPSQNVTENDHKVDSDRGSLTEGASAEESNLQTIALKGDNNSVVNVNDSNSDSNSTGTEEPKDADLHLEELPNSSNNNTESSASENIIRAGASDEVGNNSDSVSEENDEIKTGKSDTSDGVDETLESTMAENPEDIPHDAIDISDASTSLEETNARVDLDTLPDIQTEGTNSEDVAAE